MVAGALIGLLIGVLTGLVTLLLLRTARAGSISDVRAIIALTAAVLAIPTFWFGGPWATTELLQMVSLTEFTNFYIISLALSYLLVIFHPVFKWIVRLGDEL